MKKAFTLVELLIVIIIIGILATIAIPQYNKMVEKGKAAEAYSNLGALKRGQLLYYAQRGVYTTHTDAMDIVLGGEYDRTTKNFVCGSAGAGDVAFTSGYGFTVAAWTNTGTVDNPVFGSPQYHLHETGDIVKTEIAAYADQAPLHSHNDGKAAHQHRLPNR